MSKRGREGAPSDEQLLAALDRLVEVEGIVKASELLEVSCRTASNCQESRHVSRRIRGVLEKYRREQAEHEEQEESEERETPPTASEPGGGEGPRLQEPDPDLRRAVGELRIELASLRERADAVEGRDSLERAGCDDGVDVDMVDVDGDDDDDEGKQQRSVAAPRRVFPELITEDVEPGEGQVYGEATELVVEWREAWAIRKLARHTLAWLRAERQRLTLESRLFEEFGLTQPPADAPRRERRRDQELDWRRRALRRLRWQLPLTSCR
ncbi:MAG: hypothetical protein OXD50_07700 [Chloroflexi bacterium]|nr:hypothetical protein [Chloroflexota bacterium]